MDNNLIVVRQLPVIEEQLRNLQGYVESRVKEALSMPCTEDTYKDVKRIRSELNKEYADLETRRKEVKDAILAPYNAFEAEYKKRVGNLYTSADADLKVRIAEVEDGLKKEKADDLMAYFDEYRESLAIPTDLVALENAGIKVGLSDTKKALRDKARLYLDRIDGDLKLIETQKSKDEIFVEYRKCLDVSKAITEVAARHKVMESERQRREAEASERSARESAVQAVEEIAAAEAVPVAAPISAPAIVGTDYGTGESETVYVAAFRVTARGADALDKLRALKKFLTEGGYEYEQL